VVSRDPCRASGSGRLRPTDGQKHLPEKTNTVRDLNHQLKQLCRRNRDGSYATQRDRERMLSLIADQLHTLGYRGMNVRSLKPKHVEALLNHWREENLSVGTLKNRMAALRWWAQKVDRQNVIARSNEHYGIAERNLSGNGSKAKTVGETDLNKVRDPHVRMSLELQRAFGLRREEAIKFSPRYADKGDHLTLKASWTKGGKARTIPVRTPHGQRRTLEAPRASTPVCARSLRGADRLEGPGRGRSAGQSTRCRATDAGPRGAAYHQPGVGSRARPDSQNLLWVAGLLCAAKSSFSGSGPVDGRVVPWNNDRLTD